MKGERCNGSRKCLEPTELEFLESFEKRRGMKMDGDVD
jgi:hypothetical protein